MFKALFPWAIGIQANNLEQAIEAARIGAFQGVEFNPSEVAERVDKSGATAVVDLFEVSGVRPAAFGLPTDWRTNEANWRAGLEELPNLASAAAAIGCGRTMTWILPGDNERTFAENYRFHVERFRPIAAILADRGISLGLEFIGPKTLRDTFKHPFVHTMDGMLEMAAEIGPNVGLLLDAWHLYTSHGSADDVAKLRASQVVYVHVNDAPAGVEIDEQLDDVRRLPGETGVIDIAGFLRALQGIGYDGPVTPEPFKKELHDLPDDTARLQAAGRAMDAIFQTAGITPK